MSHFSYIPHDLLKGHDNIKLIEIRNTTLMSLSDTDMAFVGAEKGVRRFEMWYCVLFGNFDWYKLRNMTHLQEIVMIDIGLKYIDIDANFPHSFNLKQLFLEYNNISYISDQGFSKFVNLENLQLRDNNISKLKRSMFPSLLSRIDLKKYKYPHQKCRGDSGTGFGGALYFIHVRAEPLVKVRREMERPPQAFFGQASYTRIFTFE
ncbi:uncharacterized protein [Parasteatoda tepidariorum]|uniref:uncharacterized protein n=1 Tax=Parasteatoda tepidariorum TaxID=114398 RepID=UPI0039BC68B2